MTVLHRAPRSTALFSVLLAAAIMAPVPVRGQCQVGELRKLTASDAAAGAAYGRVMDASGRRVVIGARAAALGGAAYVYRHVGNTWIQEAELTPSDAQAGDWFGSSVAIDGDVVVVGAIADDDRGSESGSAYVFRFEGGQWVEEDKLTASDGTRDDWFGTSVAVHGDTIVVGAPLNELTLPGGAYVYRFDGADWVEQTKLVPSNGGDRDHFGIAVAVGDNIAVVGAWNFGNTGQTFPDGIGAAYVFEFDGVQWVERDQLFSTDPLDGERDRFGQSLALEGDVLLVGTDPISFGPTSPAGSAYVFRNNGEEWRVDAKLVSSDAQGGDRFGSAVSLSGGTALIGAWGEWSTGEDCPFPRICHSGAAYVYRSDGGSWTEQAKLVSSDISDDDTFGWSVALSEGLGFVGAWRDDDAGSDSGSVYYFPGLTDCNANGTLDTCDVANGTSLDANGNGVPDECEQPGDLDGDGCVGQSDLGILLGDWNCQAGCVGDIDGNGSTGQSDLGILLANWGAGC